LSTPWSQWLTRWDRFQEAYVPGRELQFRLIVDYLALLHRDSPLRVLDLCAGPGSFGSRLLEERPDARVVALDHDPWLLELGRRIPRVVARLHEPQDERGRSSRLVLVRRPRSTTREGHPAISARGSRGRVTRYG